MKFSSHLGQPSDAKTALIMSCSTDGKAAAKSKNIAPAVSSSQASSIVPPFHVQYAGEEGSAIDETTLDARDPGTNRRLDCIADGVGQYPVISVGDVKRPHAFWVADALSAVRVTSEFLRNEKQQAVIEVLPLLLN